MNGKNPKRGDICEFKSEYEDDDMAIAAIHDEIVTKSIKLPPIRYITRYDTGKMRKIGIQNIKSQIYDYIAVNALSEVFKSIGRWQCAGIKGRGPLTAKSHIENMMGKNNCRYFLKGDIKKFFDSIDQNVVIRLIKTKVKNNDLIWLIEELLKQFDRGVSIGSYLSQWLANWLMSFLYHNLEECHYIRKKKRSNKTERISLVTGMCFYMDDFVVFTNSKRGLREIRKIIDQTLDSLNLQLKREPQIGQTNKHCIDLVGYKIWQSYTTIRRRDFIKARKSFKRFAKRPTVHGARRCISYFGFFKHSNSRKFRCVNSIDNLFIKAKRMVSSSAKRKEGNMRHSKRPSLHLSH